MGIMDTLFRSADTNPGTSSTAIPPSQTGQSPAPPPPSAGAPAVANSPVAAPAVAAPPANSLLDPFKDFWNTPVDADGKPVAQTPDPLAAPIFNFDPTKISAQVKTLDFVKDIKPELISGLVENGQLNTANLLELINTVAQNSMAAATLSTGNMVNQATTANNARMKTALPGVINGVSLAGMPIGDNPVLNHPAVQPLVKALRTAAFAKDANANPAEVSANVERYIAGLAEAMQATTPAATAATAAEAAKKQDWSNYFDIK